MRFVQSILILALTITTAISLGADFKSPESGLALTFPKDHGCHKDYRIEWWYFTGNLAAEDGNRFGFQLTFFRFGLAPQRKHKASVWQIDDIYPAHFAITDITGRKFWYSELVSRSGPGLAGADDKDLNVFVKDWSAKRTDKGINLSATEAGNSIELALVPVKPVVLHGDKGFSQKSPDPAQASYYSSLTRLQTSGKLAFGGKTYDVSGLSWMDHEFSTSMLKPQQAGWDWFSLQLDNGTELMLFRIRNRDGSVNAFSGSFIDDTGEKIDLNEVNVQELSSWKSPESGATYPAGWKIDIPTRKISLEVAPAIPNQELTPKRTTNISYWEGSVTLKGSCDDGPVEGRGYVELTGYVESIGGRF